MNSLDLKSAAVTGTITYAIGTPLPEGGYQLHTFYGIENAVLCTKNECEDSWIVGNKIIPTAEEPALGAFL